MTALTGVGAGRWTGRLRRLMVLVAALPVLFALGMVFGLIGGRYGPGVMAGLPIALLLAAVVIERPLVGPALVALSLPVGLVGVPTGLVPLQVVEVAALGVAGLVVLRRIGTGAAPLPWLPVLWWALALLGLALLASPGAVSPFDALKTDAGLVTGLLLALVVVDACRDPGELRRLAWVFAGVGTAMSLLGLRAAGSIETAYGGAVAHNRITGSFSQPNELGSFSAMVLMVSTGLLLGARTRRERIGAAVATAAALGALLFSLSRAAWVGTVLGGLALLVLLPASRRLLATVGIPVVLAAALLGAFNPDNPQVQVVRQRLDTFADPTANPYDSRPAIWREARREILDRPWLGHGPGNFYEASTRSASRAQTVGALHAHNALLTVAAEAGVLAALMVVGLTLTVGIGLRRALRRMRSARDAALAAGVGCALVTVIGQGLLDYTLTNAVLFLTVWLLLGMLLVAIRDGRRA